MKFSNIPAFCCKLSILTAFILVHEAVLPSPAFAKYVQTNFVSDIPNLAANTDPNLVNPWGIAFSPTSPFWISDNRSGLSTLYNGAGQASPLVVTIPPPVGGLPPAAPTGVVFNGSSNFALTPGNPARFIFSTENGTISGWSPSVAPTNAILKVDNSGAGAVYKGLTMGTAASGPMLYAANFKAGAVEVFDGNFSPVSLPGAFSDPSLPAGYAPFNIQNIGGALYVTFALQDAAKQDDVAGPGNGIIDIFDGNGTLVRRVASGGALNSPWGLALAPSDFGDFSNDLLIGNFGDGRINAFDPVTDAFLGSLTDPSGNPITIAGLWGLTFGNGGLGGDKNSLYFTAGIPGNGQVEDHGLFGRLSSVPEPRPIWLMAGFLLLFLRRNAFHSE